MRSNSERAPGVALEDQTTGATQPKSELEKALTLFPNRPQSPAIQNAILANFTLTAALPPEEVGGGDLNSWLKAARGLWQLSRIPIRIANL